MRIMAGRRRPAKAPQAATSDRKRRHDAEQPPAQQGGRNERILSREADSIAAMPMPLRDIATGRAPRPRKPAANNP